MFEDLVNKKFDEDRFIKVIDTETICDFCSSKNCNKNSIYRDTKKHPLHHSTASGWGGSNSDGIIFSGMDWNERYVCLNRLRELVVNVHEESKIDKTLEKSKKVLIRQFISSIPLQLKNDGSFLTCYDRMEREIEAKRRSEDVR